MVGLAWVVDSQLKAKRKPERETILAKAQQPEVALGALRSSCKEDELLSGLWPCLVSSWVSGTLVPGDSR